MRRPSDVDADFLTRIAPFIAIDGGRNLNEMSRELSIPYQTMRMRMLGLKDIGISVLAIPDLDKLGLERAKVFFELTPGTTKEIRAFFGGLHQSAGENPVKPDDDLVDI